MDKTLYVTDLDGTLMRNDKSISEHSLGIINNLIAAGANFTVATARSVSSVKDIDELFNGDVGYITMIDDKENLEPVYDRVKGASGWETVFQQDSYDSEYWLELCPENRTKAKAIVRLKEKLGLDKIVVFGDSVNDIPMFKIADEAYAVENALPELKEYATKIIASNEADGVAEFLRARFA